MVYMVNTGDLGNASSEIWRVLGVAFSDKLSPLVTIFKAVGIAILVYIIFLIIRALFRWKSAIDIGKIAKNVEEINDKLDLLLGKKRIEIKEEKEKTEKIKKEKKGKK